MFGDCGPHATRLDVAQYLPIAVLHGGCLFFAELLTHNDGGVKQKEVQTRLIPGSHIALRSLSYRASRSGIIWPSRTSKRLRYYPATPSPGHDSTGVGYLLDDYRSCDGAAGFGIGTSSRAGAS
jgi:hypothetical protein